jgi:hypothetical protein
MAMTVGPVRASSLDSSVTSSRGRLRFALIPQRRRSPESTSLPVMK